MPYNFVNALSFGQNFGSSHRKKLCSRLSSVKCFDTVGWVIWSVKTCVWWDVKPYSINQSLESA